MFLAYPSINRLLEHLDSKEQEYIWVKEARTKEYHGLICWKNVARKGQFDFSLSQIQ